MKLKTGAYLIVDPCYIKKVSDGNTNRYDALRLMRSWELDDGGYMVVYTAKGKEFSKTLGVDSGRIWALKAEFACEVKIDSGFSGEIVADELKVDSVQIFGAEDD